MLNKSNKDWLSNTDAELFRIIFFIIALQNME